MNATRLPCNRPSSSFGGSAAKDVVIRRATRETLHVHLLSDHNRSEFLATPQLVRFDHAKGEGGRFEPSLLIKGDALVLKYLVRGVRVQFVAARVRGDRLLYGILVFDDPAHPAMLWSIMEREQEQRAMFALAGGEPCQLFLFNELAINVAWHAMSADFSSSRLGSLAASAALGPVDHSVLHAAVDDVIARALGADPADPELLVVDLPVMTDWRMVNNSLVTNSAGISHLDAFDPDEGRQQERVIAWLTDNLFPSVAIDQPRVHKGGKLRELTDALLSYPLGTFLFESKALSLLDRPTLPDRSTLAKNLLGHVAKAARQLKGATRQVKAGTDILDERGNAREIERTRPIHAIILVPDIRLLPDPFGADLMHDFMTATGGYLHLLDPSELLRIVQTTAEFVRRSESQLVTPMMAFDSRLIARAEQCAANGSLVVEIVTHFEDR